MPPAFSNYRRRAGNLWVPGAIDELMSLDPAELAKADKDSKLAGAITKKMGALFALYYQIWSNISSYGAAEKPRQSPTHRFLREVAKTSLIDKLLINARAHQVRQVSRRVVVDKRQKGWRVVHVEAANPNFKSTPDIERRSNQMEDLIDSPNPEVHASGVRDVLLKALKGLLVIDRVAMVVTRDGAGRPVSYHLLPPDEIKPRLEVLLSFMKQYGTKNEDAATNRIFREFGVDVSDAAYIQEFEGKVYGAWDRQSMSVLVENPSDELNRFGYGSSPVEDSLEATTLMMHGLNYNKTAFTCSRHDGRVLTDRGAMKIHEIVNGRLPVMVRALDGDAGTYAWRRVVGWHKYPIASTWIRIEHELSGSRLFGPLHVTPEHKLQVLLADGRVEKVAAKSIVVGDRLVTELPSLSTEQREALLGTLLGDGSLRLYRGGKAPSLTCDHSDAQADYLEWKRRAFLNLDPRVSQRSHPTGHKSGRIDTPCTYALSGYRQICYADGRKTVTREWLSNVGALGLAVWFMDDGCVGGSKAQKPRATIAFHPSAPEERAAITDYFASVWGLRPSWRRDGGSRGHVLAFSTEDSEKLFGIIGEWVRVEPSDYSVPSKRWVGRDIVVGPSSAPSGVRVTSVSEAAAFSPKYRPRSGKGLTGFCYDITVEGAHAYTLNRMGSGNSNFPEAFLFLEGDVDPEGLEAWKKQMYAATGPAGEQRLPVFATGDKDYRAQLVKLRDSLREMQFLQLLRFAIALKCAAFRAHPSLVNFSGDFGKDRAVISDEDDEPKIAAAQEEGFNSLLDGIGSWFTRVLIRPWYPDLEMVWQVDAQPTEAERVQLLTGKVGSYMLVDEARAADGLPPMAEATGGRVTGEFSNSQGFSAAQQMKLQAERPDVAAPGDEGDGYSRPGQGEPVPMPSGWTPSSGTSKKTSVREKDVKRVEKSLSFDDDAAGGLDSELELLEPEG